MPARAPGGLTAESLERICRASNLVKHSVWLPRVSSTQDEARRLARTHGSGVLVVAAQQTGGHGRLGREWFSPPGGLWLSIALAPLRPRNEWPLTTQLAALALRDALKTSAGLTTGIKWPNDLLARGRKIAGILAEAGSEGPLILGVGVNVARPAGGWPRDIAPSATSLEDETGAGCDLADLLAEFLAALESHLLRFESEGPEAVRREILPAALLIGRRVTVEMSGAGLQDAIDETACARKDCSSGQRITGRAVDIGPLGELVLEADEPCAESEPRTAAGPKRTIRVTAGTVVEIAPPLD